MLAHHYSTALDLARATGDEAQATALRDPAFRFLSLAGERATSLDVPLSLGLLERAIALTPTAIRIDPGRSSASVQRSRTPAGSRRRSTC